MKHLIDLENWERVDNFNFFRSYVNSWYSVTTEIECTEAFVTAKSTGTSFFLRYLHAVLCAANEIEALRYRTDKEGRVVLHDTVDMITPVAIPGKTFVTVRIPYDSDFERFQVKARELISHVQADGDPYGVEKELYAKGDFDVMHLSAVPKMYFTSITYTIYEAGNGCTHPLSTMGKVIRRGKQSVMPFSVYVNHAFVDGEHLSRFFEKIQERLTR